MADDNTVRSYRSSETHRRDSAVGAEAPPRSDPLAELARLIGQNDPFAEFAANNGRQPAEHQAAAVAPSSTLEWRRSTPSSVTRAEPPAADARAAPATPAYQRRDPHQMASGGERLAQPDFDESYESDQSADAFGLQPPHASPPVAADDAGDADAFLAQGEPMGQDDDELYDDAPASRRGGAGVAALTIIICAAVGSASAYGYRSYTMVARATQVPPIITAEKTPTKVVPANDAQSGKSIQDRVRDGGPAERVVSREEQPVELRNMISTTPPRVVLQSAETTATVPPSSVFPPPPATVGSLPPQPAAAAANAAPVGEPKRVRTVTIRPEAGDLSGRPSGVSPTSPLAAAPPSTRGAAPPPPARNGGPISLDPQAQASAPPPARTPAAAAPAPTRVAAAPTATATATTGGGGYVVQISSQKSDAEAQASIRTLQAKYPHLLNSKPPHVSRADLGAKGVFYRAVVGPFASAGEASSFCSGLKAAGGQCIIQKN